MFTARLENWAKAKGYEGSFFLWGYVFDDKRKRFTDGSFIHTSEIQERDLKEGDIVQTLNSSYLLGKQFKG